MPAITAIIATLNELPQNLERTVDGLRGHGVRVSVVEDDPVRLGCGYRRNQGILAASTELVFLCDAHMDFEQGFFNAMAGELAAHPDAVVVGRMQSMDHGWRDIAGHLYAGAEIQTKYEAPGGQYVPIAARWRRKHEGGAAQIGAVMGACYGFTRSHYERMGRPLSILRGWGCDEELLSIASYMVGGCVRLMMPVARHMYAAPRQRPIELTPADILHIWGNRLAMLRAIPMKPETRDRLAEWLRKTDYADRNWVELIGDVATRNNDIRRMYHALAMPAMPFEAYLEKWCNGRTAEDREKDKQDGERMMKADKARTTKNGKKIGRPLKVPEVARTEMVADLGLPCRHCGERYGHKVVRTYDNENRLIKCGKCGGHFIAVRGAC